MAIDGNPHIVAALIGGICTDPRHTDATRDHTLSLLQLLENSTPVSSSRTSGLSMQLLMLLWRRRVAVDHQPDIPPLQQPPARHKGNMLQLLREAVIHQPDSPSLQPPPACQVIKHTVVPSLPVSKCSLESFTVARRASRGCDFIPCRSPRSAGTAACRHQRCKAHKPRDSSFSRRCPLATKCGYDDQ